MYRYASIVCTATLLLTSCYQKDTQSSMTSEKGSCKPKVAIAPVIDNSQNPVEWSLSDELTYSLFERLQTSGELSLADPQRIKSITRKLSTTTDPFGQDLSWVKRSFSSVDFVIFMEVLEHKEVPITKQASSNAKDVSSNLAMTCKVIVLDVRQDHPKIILQEIVQDTHFIPRQFNQYNFHQTSWGNEDFSLSPVGMAHAQFLKEISFRIEDYILLSKDD